MPNPESKELQQNLQQMRLKHPGLKKKPSLCTGSKKKILKGCKQQKTDFSFLWLKGTELNERSEGAREQR